MPEEQESGNEKIGSRPWAKSSWVLGMLILIFIAWVWHTQTINSIMDDYEQMIVSAEKEKEIYKEQARAELEDLRNPTRAKREGLIQIVQESQPKLDPQLTERVVDTVLHQCEIRDVDPVLITALIWKESRFDPFAESNKGAVGLTQVMYSVWKETHELESSGVDSKAKLFWIEPNISAGVEIFSKYYEESGYDVVVALNRYHTGSQGLPKGKAPNEISYAMDILIRAYEIKARLEREY